MVAGAADEDAAVEAVLRVEREHRVLVALELFLVDFVLGVLGVFGGVGLLRRRKPG